MYVGSSDTGQTVYGISTLPVKTRHQTTHCVNLLCLGDNWSNWAVGDGGWALCDGNLLGLGEGGSGHRRSILLLDNLEALIELTTNDTGNKEVGVGIGEETGWVSLDLGKSEAGTWVEETSVSRSSTHWN